MNQILKPEGENFQEFSNRIPYYDLVTILPSHIIARKGFMTEQYVVNAGDEIYYNWERNAYCIKKGNGEFKSCQKYFGGNSRLWDDYIFLSDIAVQLYMYGKTISEIFEFE